MANSEPVYTSSLTGGVVTGTMFTVLQQPVTDIMLELGASERLSKALTSIFMFILPLVVAAISAWWARRHTVPVVLANQQIEKAFNTQTTAPNSALDNLKIPAVGD